MKKCIDMLVICPYCRSINNIIKIYINYSNEIICCCICLDKLDNNSKKYSVCGDIRHAMHSKCYKKYIKYNKNNEKLTNNNILFISYLFIILHLLRIMSLFII